MWVSRVLVRVGIKCRAFGCVCHSTKACTHLSSVLIFRAVYGWVPAGCCRHGPIRPCRVPRGEFSQGHPVLPQPHEPGECAPHTQTQVSQSHEMCFASLISTLTGWAWEDSYPVVIISLVTSDTMEPNLRDVFFFPSCCCALHLSLFKMCCYQI